MTVILCPHCEAPVHPGDLMSDGFCLDCATSRPLGAPLWVGELAILVVLVFAVAAVVLA